MTEAEAIRLIIAHLESQFPKSCLKCGRQFASLREYVSQTNPLGSPVAYDMETVKHPPADPIGTVVLANCPCGTTLALTSQGMPLLQYWTLFMWSAHLARRRGLSLREVHQYVREEIRKQVLAAGSAT